MELKRCTKCGETKELGEFSKDKGEKDGLNIWCGCCVKAQNRRTKERYKALHTEEYYSTITGEKRCTRCFVIKDFEKFYRSAPTSKDGFSSYCKVCTSAIQTEQGTSTKAKQRRKTPEGYVKWSMSTERLSNQNKLLHDEQFYATQAGEKRCPQCKATKPLEQFHRSPTTKDGRAGYCKQCVKDYQCLADSRKRKRISDKKYRETDNYRISTEKKRKSPVYKMTTARLRDKYRAIARNVPSDLTAKRRLEIMEEFDHTCVYCGNTGIPLEIDHVLPMTRGGFDTRDNAFPCCRRCNAQKYNHTPLEWFGEEVHSEWASSLVSKYGKRAELVLDGVIQRLGERQN